MRSGNLLRQKLVSECRREVHRLRPGWLQIVEGSMGLRLADFSVFGPDLADDVDLTGPFCTRRFERDCLGKEAGHAEEEVWC